MGGWDSGGLALNCYVSLPAYLPTEHNKPDPSDTAGTGLDELPGADGRSPHGGAVPHEHGVA